MSELNPARIPRPRFRLWQLFAMVTIVALVMWLITQVGMVTAEIEVVEFETWPRTSADESESEVEVINVKFRYRRPEELRNTSLILFCRDATFTDARNIEVGTRIQFRYRAKPLLWMNPVKPDPIAIGRVGLNRIDIEEIITEVSAPNHDE